MKSMRSILTAVLSLAIGANASAACVATDNARVELQILGAGGPNASGGRASSAYLLWIDGVGRILIDAGGGTKNAFAAAGGNFDDIDLVALSHLHPDHSAELPALFWPTGGAVTVAGPTAGNVFPSIGQFVERLFGADGVYAILAPRLELETVTVDVTARAPAEVWRDGDVVVRGLGVPHGDVPAVGFRIDVGDSSIAFSSDQNGSNPAFVDFVRGVDVLVIHLAAPENATGMIAELHAKPSVWGQMAAAAGAGRVVASHISVPGPDELDARLDILRQHYRGPVTVAEDSMCVAVN
jgi:ribonuclease BN (tRNA processing enzyme)